MNSDTILITGGGLSGLCLAQGLSRAGLRFRLYEPDTVIGSSDKAYRLRINAAGQEALARCLPVDLLYLLHRTASLADAEPRFVDADAAALALPDAANRGAGRSGLPDLCVDPRALRAILSCGLQSRVQYGHELRAFAECAGGVVTRFVNGAEIAGDLLVGSGCQDTLAFRHPVAAKTSRDAGSLSICGRTPATITNCAAIGRELCAGTTVVLAGDVIAAIDVITFGAPLPAIASQIVPDCRLHSIEDHFCWSLTISGGMGASPMPPDGSEDMLRTVVSSVRAWSPQLQAVFLNSDPASLSVQPSHRSEVDPSWTAPRAAFLGDAPLAVAPGNDWQTGLALQEAAELVEYIVRTRHAGAEMDMSAFRAAGRERAAVAAQLSHSISRDLAPMMAA